MAAMVGVLIVFVGMTIMMKITIVLRVVGVVIMGDTFVWVVLSAHETGISTRRHQLTR